MSDKNEGFYIDNERHFLAAIVESSHDAIMGKSIDGVIFSWNKAAEKLYGYTSDEVIGKNVSMLAPDSQKHETLNLLQKIKAGGKIEQHETTRIRKDGRSIYISLSISPIKNDEGEIIGASTIARDITSRRLSEIFLSESEERYRTLFEQAADSIFLIEPAGGRMIESNYQAYRTFGYTREEFKDLSLSDLFVSDEEDRADNFIFNVLNKGFDTQETKMKKKNGEHISVFINSRVVSIKGNQFLQCICRDFTERRKVIDALLDSQRRFRSLVGSMEDLVYTIDTDQTVTGVYGKWLEKTGIKPEKVLGRGIEALLGEENLELHKKAFEQSLNGRHSVYEWSVVNENKNAYYQTSLSPIMSSSREITGIVAVSRDITKRKLDEQELNRSREILVNFSSHLQKIREEERAFIAREIHDDLGQTLTALKIDLSWLKNNIGIKKEEIEAKIINMLEINDKMIGTIKRISSELRPGILDDFGLSAAIEWQANEMQNRSGIRLNVDISPEEIILNNEISIAIYRLFQESVTNIIRHSGATHADVILRLHDNLFTMRVRDNGVGISDKQIFGPRSLGLIGMRERLRPFDGTLIIHGEKNKGTELFIEIPLEEDESNNS